MALNVKLNRTDRRIWDELDSFVPREIIDVHTHLYLWEFNSDPDKDKAPEAGKTWPAKPFREDFPIADWGQSDKIDQILMPGRKVHRISFGMPFAMVDFEATNQFIADQVVNDSESHALMLINPKMTADYLEKHVTQNKFIGFKPYRLYSVTGDVDNCRITDFIAEHQIEVAHRLGLIIMMHVSKRNAIADQDNIDDMKRLSETYPNAKWILAHCGRSYSSWAIEKGGKVMRDLPNVWFDTSAVTETDAIDALLSTVGSDKVMYGSDDIPFGVMRGKLIAFGYSWALLTEDNHSFALNHCDGKLTFIRYEELRAIHRAVKRYGESDKVCQDLFYNNAKKLIDSVSPNVPSTL